MALDLISSASSWLSLVASVVRAIGPVLKGIGSRLMGRTRSIRLYPRTSESEAVWVGLVHQNSCRFSQARAPQCAKHQADLIGESRSTLR
jgi:hypothetical protein